MEFELDLSNPQTCSHSSCQPKSSAVALNMTAFVVREPVTRPLPVLLLQQWLPPCPSLLGLPSQHAPISRSLEDHTPFDQSPHLKNSIHWSATCCLSVRQCPVEGHSSFEAGIDHNHHSVPRC